MNTKRETQIFDHSHDIPDLFTLYAVNKDGSRDYIYTTSVCSSFDRKMFNRCALVAGAYVFVPYGCSNGGC